MSAERQWAKEGKKLGIDALIGESMKDQKPETGHIGNAEHSLFICKYCEEQIGGCSCSVKKKVNGLGICYKCEREIIKENT